MIILLFWVLISAACHNRPLSFNIGGCCAVRLWNRHQHHTKDAIHQCTEISFGFSLTIYASIGNRTTQFHPITNNGSFCLKINPHLICRPFRIYNIYLDTMTFPWPFLRLDNDWKLIWATFKATYNNRQYKVEKLVLVIGIPKEISFPMTKFLTDFHKIRQSEFLRSNINFKWRYS